MLVVLVGEPTNRRENNDIDEREILLVDGSGSLFTFVSRVSIDVSMTYDELPRSHKYDTFGTKAIDNQFRSSLV